MNLIYKLLTGKFDFLIPVSYMILGVFIAAMVFAIRYSIYRRRKKRFTQQTVVDGEAIERNEHKSV